MNLLDDIINIKITRDSKGLSSASFNTLLVIGNSEGKTRVKTYSSLQEVSADFESATSEFAIAQLAFGQSTKLDKIIIGQVFEDEGIEQAYRAIAEVSTDFYAVVITSKEIEDQLKIAALIEAENRILGISGNDPKMLDDKDTENVLHRLKELNTKRTFVIYNSCADKIYPEAAWLGLMLTKQAGSSTWAFKALSGFPADRLNSEKIRSLEAKNGNYFCSMAGKDVIFNGKMASGEHIDTIIGLDWVMEELKTQIGSAITGTEKIPYTNHGIAIIESIIIHTLKRAASNDIIDAESIIVNAPTVQDIPKSDRLKRILPDVKFEARLVGAIHQLKIQGTIMV
jgi:hypothetical protein